MLLYNVAHGAWFIWTVLSSFITIDAADIWKLLFARSFPFPSFYSLQPSPSLPLISFSPLFSCLLLARSLGSAYAQLRV